MAHGKFHFSGTGLSCFWLTIWTTVLVNVNGNSCGDVFVTN